MLQLTETTFYVIYSPGASAIEPTYLEPMLHNKRAHAMRSLQPVNWHRGGPSATSDGATQPDLEGETAVNTGSSKNELEELGARRGRGPDGVSRPSSSCLQGQGERAWNTGAQVLILDRLWEGLLCRESPGGGGGVPCGWRQVLSLLIPSLELLEHDSRLKVSARSLQARL